MHPHIRLSRLFLVLLLLVLPACTTSCLPEKTAVTNPAEQLGITLAGIHLSSTGYMLDFRFRVIDPVKAQPMFDQAIIPYLIDEASGAKFMVPAPAKTGPLQQMPHQAEAGRTYFVFFSNPAQFIKTGDRATIVYGPYRFEHLEVL